MPSSNDSLNLASTITEARSLKGLESGTSMIRYEEAKALLAALSFSLTKRRSCPRQKPRSSLLNLFRESLNFDSRSSQGWNLFARTVISPTLRTRAILQHSKKHAPYFSGKRR